MTRKSGDLFFPRGKRGTRLRGKIMLNQEAEARWRLNQIASALYG
jgi:hypothetical protein